ncbi:transposase [candidate division WOR-3 bacterium]|nr:transposase [candidate division WOR-3 bacterium]
MGRPSKWSSEEKVRIVLTGIRGDKSIAQICRDHEISETTYYKWMDKFIEGAKEAFRGRINGSREKALKAKISELQRIIGKITVENEILKKTEEMIKGNGRG